MRGFRNIFACLVHESRDCVVDLVRNLRYLDPASSILLYNGGSDPELLGRGFPFERYGAVAVPGPRPLSWGWLHEFALDCIRHAVESSLPFDTITVVDSDQLALRPGYSAALRRFLSDRPGVGMIASTAGPQAQGSTIPPVQSAWEEFDLWRPFLRRFPEGESKYVHWTFWPSTVFTQRAARDLVSLFDDDAQLRATMAQSRIWATEEILLPTLVALLGHEVVASPFRGEFVQYRVGYPPEEVERALDDDGVFWIHPVARHYGDDLRRRIRTRHNHYESPFEALAGARTVRQADEPPPRARSAASLPGKEVILARLEQTEGWLSRSEAELLITVASRALTAFGSEATVVEVGSFCGRATLVLGGVAAALCPLAKVYAVDPFDGVVGAVDQGLFAYSATLERFQSNVARAGLVDVVVPIALRAVEVTWTRPIGLLLIDGLHDYASVAGDFFAFEASVVAGGYLVFHDYAAYFPGVVAFVNELLGTGGYQEIDRAESLFVMRKAGSG